MIDLNSLTLPELEKLRKDVARAIETFRARQKAAARAELEELARARGFTLAELLEAAPARSRRRAAREAPAAKYRHPENPALTWSGRGRIPGWIKAHEAAGKSREDFRITA